VLGATDREARTIYYLKSMQLESLEGGGLPVETQFLRTELTETVNVAVTQAIGHGAEGPTYSIADWLLGLYDGPLFPPPLG